MGKAVMKCAVEMVNNPFENEIRVSKTIIYKNQTYKLKM